jgi:hypothetical protein
MAGRGESRWVKKDDAEATVELNAVRTLMRSMRLPWRIDGDLGYRKSKSQLSKVPETEGFPC